MKYFPLFSLTLALAAAAVSPLQAESEPAFLVKPDDVITVCGDSITNMKEYPAFLEDYLLMCQPVPGIRVAQFGISGETATGFIKRMDQVVLPFKPTFATLCYGMNDAKLKAKDPEFTEEYRKSLTEAVSRFKGAGVRTGIIASPGVVDDFYHKGTPGYNDSLAQLRNVAREVAEKEGFAFADLHAQMAETMKSAKATHGEDYVFAGGDGVHPAPVGHLTMAYGILKAMGCDGNIGQFTVDWAAQQAQAREGHKVVAFTAGKLDLESSRYPFCFLQANSRPGHKKGLDSILPHLPFNKELNRFILRVNGLDGKNAKVTWGNESKEFSAAQLENGVNLAEEFLINPFTEPFHKVHESVRAHQNAEGKEMREILHPLMKEPDAEKVKQVQEETVTASNARAKATRELVMPVNHVILIEPLS